MMKNKINLKKIKGFTLIELLVVISIVSLLSSIILSSLAEAREDAKISKARQELQQIRNAFELYVNANDSQGPSGWSLFNCSGSSQDTSNVPNGSYVNDFASDLEPYISEIPTDPWGNQYFIDAIYNCDPNSGTNRNNFPEGCLAQDQGEWIYALGSAGPSGVAPVGNYQDWADTGYDSDNVILMVCDYTN